jgi:hypothetical protein
VATRPVSTDKAEEIAKQYRPSTHFGDYLVNQKVSKLFAYHGPRSAENIRFDCELHNYASSRTRFSARAALGMG